MCWLSAFALDDKSKERRDIPLKEVSRCSLLKRKKCRRLSRERCTCKLKVDTHKSVGVYFFRGKMKKRR